LEGDRREAGAIKDIFEKDNERVYISAVKLMTGEQYSNSGALQVAAAVAAIEKQMVPKISTKAQSAKIRNVLVNAFGKSGTSSSLIISKFER
jgi:3-oxoacyl-(acyl-carrier-protein) synthase